MLSILLSIIMSCWVRYSIANAISNSKIYRYYYFLLIYFILFFDQLINFYYFRCLVISTCVIVLESFSEITSIKRVPLKKSSTKSLVSQTNKQQWITITITIILIIIGLVVVMNPQEPANHHLLDGIALSGLHLKFDAIIYVAPGNLSLLQCVQVWKIHLILW